MIEQRAQREASSCVLIVDDEEGTRESLREVVEMAGRTAVTASNGREALELLARWHPCLIILDLIMPVMSGEEMLEAMRKEPTLAKVPVVISTSAPARAPAGIPVIPKPVDIDRVWDWMRRTCLCAKAPIA
jgi:two-component system response regulator CpxR